MAQTNNTEWTRLAFGSSKRHPFQWSAKISVKMRRAVSKSSMSFAVEAFHQEFGRLVVQPATAHIDRFDLRGRGRTDGLVVAVADHLVVPHGGAEGRQRQVVSDQRGAVAGTDLETKLVVHQPDMKRIRAAIVSGRAK